MQKLKLILLVSTKDMLTSFIFQGELKCELNEVIGIVI